MDIEFKIGMIAPSGAGKTSLIHAIYNETKERLILLASFIPNSLLSGVIRFFDDESGRCQELLDRCVDILDKYHE